MSIADNLKKIQSKVPDHVTLVAISKTKPAEAVQEAYHAGQLHFGENKVQEMTEKQEQLPHNIFWHQVGHLQRNKVKYIAPYVHLIHSVDSVKLLLEIQKQAKKQERTIQALLQIHIAEEDTKFGLNEAELIQLLEDPELLTLNGVLISGMMGMATNTSDEKQVAREFKGLRELFEKTKDRFSSHPHCMWNTLSMGMSGDYRIAIEEGSNMIRVGSAIFGERNYK